jgi:hypothetical protein
MNRPGNGNETETIVWRLHLAASAERVFAAWKSPEDHARFWCERSEETPSGFSLHFIDGTVETCVIEESSAPSHIGFRYFGSRVDIHLERAEAGTDLTLEARDVPREEWHEVHAGWLNVLLPFKAWVDFGIDLRNHDAARTWRQRYADQ